MSAIDRVPRGLTMTQRLMRLGSELGRAEEKVNPVLVKRGLQRRTLGSMAVRFMNPLRRNADLWDHEDRKMSVQPNRGGSGIDLDLGDAYEKREEDKRNKKETKI